jgi:guanosine-3',5'-bis(diphosphate) 3'-pyrophosphohydrolase
MRNFDTQATRSILAFATRAHANQERISGVPYIIHPYAVASLVTLHSEIFASRYLAAYQAALLHDVIEDTAITYAQIESKTSHLVADAVQALTKNPAVGNDRAQLVDSLMRAKAVGDWVVWIKAFDRIDNINFALCPPARTDEQFENIFLENGDILNAVHETNGGDSVARLLQGAHERYSKFAGIK